MEKEKQPSRDIDSNWEAIFNFHDILKIVEESGYFIISAKQIKVYKEPRLMAKFDQKASLPAIFKRHKLSILPISRSKYIIGYFNTHKDIEDNEDLEIIPCTFPANIESIDYKDMFSEAIALNCAYNIKIIDDLVGQETRLTVTGRMSTGKFEFNILNSKDTQTEPYQILVENSQCEIDGGFESDDYFVIIEAKNITVESFLIRQLYYPYRLWSSKLINKHVIPVLMTFSDDIYTFYIYSFNDETNYNSISLKEVKKYRIADESISRDEVSSIFSTVTPHIIQNMMFPQADRFESVLDLLNFLDRKEKSKEEIAICLGFDVRQADYYANAASSLGLVERVIEKNSTFKLTGLGESLLKKSHKPRYVEYIKLILQNRVFYEAFQIMQKKGDFPSKEEAIEILERHKDVMKSMNRTTIMRRSTTVIGWIHWIWKQIDDKSY